MSGLPRERVQAALAFRAPDVIPLQIFAVPGGLHEHGQNLLDLVRRCGHDFGPFDDLRLPEPPPAADFDPDGAYHAVRTNEWGVTWEYRIFGVWGHPLTRPSGRSFLCSTRRRWRGAAVNSDWRCSCIRTAAT
jgi:hypothetical protein